MPVGNIEALAEVSNVFSIIFLLPQVGPYTFTATIDLNHIFFGEVREVSSWGSCQKVFSLLETIRPVSPPDVLLLL